MQTEPSETFLPLTRGFDMTRITPLATAAMLTLASSAVLAQAPAAPAWSATANVSIGSEYIFRGISQTGGQPTVQGGLDVAHAGGRDRKSVV